MKIWSFYTFTDIFEKLINSHKFSWTITYYKSNIDDILGGNKHMLFLDYSVGYKQLALNFF